MNAYPWRQALSFVVAAGVLLGLVGVVMGEFRFDEREEYSALFSNINGLDEGADVRASGVSVGRVGDIGLREDGIVRVRFSATTKVPLDESTRAAVRYQSLTGVKYLELLPGETRDRRQPRPLEADGTLPVTSTDPGLDLDAVFNGFKPLVRSLSPNEVNELSASVIEVFQGQTASVQSLLAHLARLTRTLGDRDELIDAMIVNFRDVLVTLDEQSADLGRTVGNVRRLMRGLAKDRTAIVNSFAATSDLAVEGAQLLAELRPKLRDTVRGVASATGAFNSDLATVNRYLAGLPIAVDAVRRLGTYGSFYNLYLCGIRQSLTTPLGAVKTPDTRDHSERCQFPEGKP